MEINELLKMISSIGQKKSKCRGNLRLKVLLKTTHDYARRSWIDGQFGNPQKLQTLLKNSGFERQSPAVTDESCQILSDEQLNSPNETLHHVQESNIEPNPPPLDKSESSEQSRLISSTEKQVPVNSGGGSSNECVEFKSKHHSPPINMNEIEALLNRNSDSDKLNDRHHECDLKLHKVVKKLLKECDLLVGAEVKGSNASQDHQTNLRKLKRIVKLSKISKIHIERDYENQDSSQQKRNRKVLKIIGKLLRQCEGFLKMNVSRQVNHHKGHHKLKKITKKLKKCEIYVEEDDSYESQLSEKLRAETDIDTDSMSLNMKEMHLTNNSFKSFGDIKTNSVTEVDCECLNKNLFNCSKCQKISFSHSHPNYLEDFQKSKLNRRSLKRSRTDMETDDDCEKLLELNDFFNNLKAVKH